jgi:hypothetical protein
MKYFISTPPAFDVPGALNDLSNLKKESNFGETPPSDVSQLLHKLASAGLPEESFTTIWMGGNWIDSYRENWIDEDQIPIDLDELGIILKKVHIWEYISSYLFLNSYLPKEMLIESANDLDCSIYLASESRFIKQAFQVLRNYCELCILVIYYHFVPNKYKIWLNDPGASSILKFREIVDWLRDSSLRFLNFPEASYLHDQYGKLNGSVHSERRRLNMGIPKLVELVENNSPRTFNEWTVQFDSIVDFMIRLYLNKIFTFSEVNR